MDPETYFLQTDFQSAIELADYWSEQPADEEKPYENKYKAIQILKNLKTTKYSFIVQLHLGQLYSDVDQIGDSFRAYQNCLRMFSELEKDMPIHNYYNQLIILYNMLGLSYLNRDDNEQGVSLLGKATQIYQAYKDLKHDDCYNNRLKPEANKQFRYYYEGGISNSAIENSYTLTQFYLAQAYTKLGFKDKAAQFCGHTLRRQFINKTYERGEFIRNLINLAEYYQGNHSYGQAEYLLLVGLRLLPEGQKKKTHANLYIALGNMLNDLLGFCSRQIRNRQEFQPNADDIISKKIFQLEGIDVKFPRLNVARDLEACKSLFRQANTQYKKALETYVLDGYVTQHIQTLFSQSKLYKHLCLIDESQERVAAMLDKRRELMQPILDQLNPKAYQNTWETVLVELADIMNELFQVKFRIMFEAGKDKVPSKSKVAVLNDCGRKAIDYYGQIEKALLESKDVEKNSQYYQSVVNAKFNQAKAFSRLYSHDNKERVEFLKKALSAYTGIRDYVKQLRKDEKFKNEFEKEEKMTQEMIEMLPAKIDRVNYGLMNGVME